MSKGRGRRRRESPKRSKGATNALAQGGYGNAAELAGNAAAGREELDRTLPHDRQGASRVAEELGGPDPQPQLIPAEAVVGGERSDGGEGLPHGVQLGDMFAAGQPAGYMDTGIVLPDGQKVWRPLPAAFTRHAGAAVLGPELPGESRTAIPAAFAGPVLSDGSLPLTTAGELMLAPSGPPLASGLPQAPDIPPAVLRQLERASGKLTPGRIRAVAGGVTGRMERQIRRGTDQLAGFRDIPGIRENWSAAEVLAAHADLAERYRHPSGALLDYLAWHMGGIRQQAGPRSVDMFYPVSPGAVPTFAHGRELAGLIAHGLVTAETYQVTAEMARSLEIVLIRRARELTWLDEAELPGAAGFGWLDAPWVVRDMNGNELPVRAMSWERCSVRSDGITGWNSRGEPVARQDPRIMPAARLVLWSMIDDDATLNPGDYADPGSLAFDQQVLGQLRMVHVQPVPFGVRFREEEAADGQPAVSVLAMVRVLWVFLGATLIRSAAVARETVVPPRPDRRRMPKSLDHTEVHVITLRKYVTLSDELPVHREVGRTCKWWVADFCRHIDSYEDYDDDGRRRRHTPVPSPRPGEDHDICEICLARGDVIRVAPVRGHIRGPAWLPLKQPAHGKTLHRLAR